MTWWILRHHGVTVMGPEPAALGFEVAWEEVRAYTLANLHTYWAAWTTHPIRLALLLTDWGIEWAVLGICRLQFALAEDRMAGKREAGEYALGRMPERWRELLREALDLRAGRDARHYRWRLRRAADAAGFVRYVIDTCTAPGVCE